MFLNNMKEMYSVGIEGMVLSATLDGCFWPKCRPLRNSYFPTDLACIHQSNIFTIICYAVRFQPLYSYLIESYFPERNLQYTNWVYQDILPTGTYFAPWDIFGLQCIKIIQAQKKQKKSKIDKIYKDIMFLCIIFVANSPNIPNKYTIHKKNLNILVQRFQ